MFHLSEEVKDAIQQRKPIVALESTVIAHGLPFPVNLETALEMEKIVRNSEAVPAMIAILKGKVRVGLTEKEIEHIARSKQIKKVSINNLPICIAKSLDGATTVASTAFIANQLGIKVFATGGIGGIHREFFFDVSADLPVLAKTPIAVVCSGAKSILDLSATREWLETYGITIIGYKSNQFPAFYSSESKLEVDLKTDRLEEIVEIIKVKENLGLETATLITSPVPHEFEIEESLLESLIEKAIKQSKEKGVKGKALTPFLLEKLSKLTKNKTTKANAELLRQNTMLASQISKIYCKQID